jgi:hypothetical protein
VPALLYSRFTRVTEYIIWPTFPWYMEALYVASTSSYDPG